MSEAAERLRSQIDGWITNDGAKAHAIANLSDALADERKATVERIRAALLGPDAPVDGLYERHTRAMLDAEAER